MSLPPDSSSPPLARFVGYSLIAGFLVFGGFCAVFVFREVRDPGTTVRVRFPEIATLSEGDAVVENGVAVGRVERIRLEGDPDGKAAVVTLKLDRRALPARDARFVNFSHSLMGARKVWIRPGLSPFPLDASRVQDGEFVPGLPETLHKVRALSEHLARARAASDRWFGGVEGAEADGGAAVLQAVGAMERAFARLAAFDSTLADATRALRAGVSTLGAFEAQAGAAARVGDPGVAHAAQRVAKARASVTELEAEVSAALARLEAMAAALDADTGVAGRLLADRSLYDSLAGGVEKLTAVVRKLQSDGLGDSLKIRPRRKR